MVYEIDWGKETVRANGIQSIDINHEQKELKIVVYDDARQPKSIVFLSKQLNAIHYYENYRIRRLGGSEVYQLRIGYLNQNNRKCQRVFILPSALETNQLDDLENFAEENEVYFDREQHLNIFSILTVFAFLFYLIMSFWRQW